MMSTKSYSYDSVAIVYVFSSPMLSISTKVIEWSKTFWCGGDQYCQIFIKSSNFTIQKFPNDILYVDGWSKKKPIM